MQIDKAKLEFWVRRYGTSSNSYVLLEGPKSYFSSPAVDGFLAYQLSGGTALIAGDPVCAPERANRLIRDFAAAMMRPVGAYQVSPAMLKAFRDEGFDDLQIGKEAVFDLHRFSLAGGSMELVRAASKFPQMVGRPGLRGQWIVESSRSSRRIRLVKRPTGRFHFSYTPAASIPT